MIKVYIYSKDTGEIIRHESGHISSVINSIKDNEDFTLTAPTSTDKQWRWNGGEWVRVESKKLSIEDRQDKVWDAIKQKRHAVITSGVYVASVDKVFHTDDSSIAQYNNIGNMITLGAYEPVQWKVMDNTWVTLTEKVFKDLQKAILDHNAKAFEVAEQHKKAMLQAENPDEYDYSDGW